MAQKPIEPLIKDKENKKLKPKGKLIVAKLPVGYNKKTQPMSSGIFAKSTTSWLSQANELEKKARMMELNKVMAGYGKEAEKMSPDEIQRLTANFPSVIRPPPPQPQTQPLPPPPPSDPESENYWIYIIIGVVVIGGIVIYMRK